MWIDPNFKLRFWISNDHGFGEALSILKNLCQYEFQNKMSISIHHIISIHVISSDHGGIAYTSTLCPKYYIITYTVNRHLMTSHPFDQAQPNLHVPGAWVGVDACIRHQLRLGGRATHSSRRRGELANAHQRKGHQGWCHLQQGFFGWNELWWTNLKCVIKDCVGRIGWKTSFPYINIYIISRLNETCSELDHWFHRNSKGGNHGSVTSPSC